MSERLIDFIDGYSACLRDVFNIEDRIILLTPTFYDGDIKDFKAFYHEEIESGALEIITSNTVQDYNIYAKHIEDFFINDNSIEDKDLMNLVIFRFHDWSWFIYEDYNFEILQIKHIFYETSYTSYFFSDKEKKFNMLVNIPS